VYVDQVLPMFVLYEMLKRPAYLFGDFWFNLYELVCTYCSPKLALICIASIKVVCLHWNQMLPAIFDDCRMFGIMPVYFN
jgi:hypothetical protein